MDAQETTAPAPQSNAQIQRMAEMKDNGERTKEAVIRTSAGLKSDEEQDA